jgi:predicted DNA-binding transcriptional regulator AlpA
VSLVEVVAALERRAAEAEREGATAPVANVYRLVLEDLRPLAGDGSNDRAAPTPDPMLTAEEVAARLGTTVRWVYRHVSRLPFVRRLGPKTLRFSAKGLDRYLATPR